ncbi:MAG: phospho-N-acetylmuramoyl-pentapeptide-transferase, partial [Cryomorphaceae bacterium BACL29 MAG-121220-bin8]
GLDGQKEKDGTPTMGGLIIIISTIIPVILFSKVSNIYIIILLFTTMWLGFIGFLDDYIKVFKQNKNGLKGKFKIIGQISLGLIVGLTLYFHPDITIKDQSLLNNQTNNIEYKSTKTTVPFLKDNELDYSYFVSWISEESEMLSLIVFLFFVILIITSVSNGANLTDGIDGLAAGSSVIISLSLAIFAWISGNIIFSEYLNIMYIPRVSEIVIFISAFIGGLIGFLWYNAFPAQIFMGDTGSLAIGGIISVIAIIVRKELLLPLICGIFLIETLSVIIQVSFFKYTKNKYGVGKRIFLMSPLHHHFQKQGYHESKIVVRFWIIGIVLSILSLITLKIR